MASELVPIVQIIPQNGNAPLSMPPQKNVMLQVDPDPALEREAEETAQRVMQGGELGIQRLADTELHVQRNPIYERNTDSSYLSGNQAGGEIPTSLMEKIDVATADAPSPSVSEVNIGSENLAEFQKAVQKDIQTLYEKIEQQGIVSQIANASADEMIKTGASEIGDATNVPFGKQIGDLVGVTLQTIYNNRNKVLEALGLKSESVVDGDSDTGGGSSTGDAESRRK